MSKVRQPNHIDAMRAPGFLSDDEGVAFVATLRGTPGRDVLDTALDALANLHHGRSQTSGILTHIPDRLLREEYGRDLPQAGTYALGFIFHTDPDSESDLIATLAAEEGFAILTWRDLPLNDTIVEISPRRAMPAMRQVILTSAENLSPATIDEKLFRLRRRVESTSDAYFASLSRTTVVYKGLVPATKLALLYPDLANPSYHTEIAIVHSGHQEHSSDWRHAQPHRVLAHDGQIHSAVSNQTWLHARLPLMDSPALHGVGEPVRGDHLVEGTLDEFVELLHRSGRSLPHALRLVIPELWAYRMSEEDRDFYDYSATVVEPWEGSGVTCFADGYLVGAVLDRHGTHSGRYWVTETGLVVFATETGVVDLDPSIITKKGRLAPGELIAVDTVIGNLLPSAAVRAQISSEHPYGEWLRENLHTIPVWNPGVANTAPEEIDPAYHLPQESRSVVEALASGASSIEETGLSRELTFFDRFRSRRSHLTSPHIDAMPLPHPPRVRLGPEHNILDVGPEHARKVLLPGPALARGQIDEIGTYLRTVRVNGVYEAPRSTYDGEGLADAVSHVHSQVDEAMAQGAQVIVLSNLGAQHGQTVPVPSMLLAASAHQHLLETGQRARVSLIVEAGDALEPDHIARLLEAGAEAVAPFHGEVLAGPQRAATYLQGLNDLVYEELLESGTAEYGAYQGSRRFHIVGLTADLVDTIFSGAARALGAFGLEDLSRQLAEEPAVLDPLHRLLAPLEPHEEQVSSEADASAISSVLHQSEPLVIRNSRQDVDAYRLATATDVLLEPPAHHDIVGSDGLRLLISEIRLVNPRVRIHVRVGADLTSDFAALEAIRAGADVINLVDGEYEWVFGLLSLRQSAPLENVEIQVGTPLGRAQDIFVAAALGATEFKVPRETDLDELTSDLTELLARQGVGDLAELRGRYEALDWAAAYRQWGAIGVDLAGTGRRKEQYSLERAPATEDSLGHSLMVLTSEAIEKARPARINAYVSNADASVGARIAGEVMRLHGREGLPADTIRITLVGSSGPSLGAYASPGTSILVQGEAGDFVGKGLSGGKIVVRPETASGFFSGENVIAGSAIGYGAQSGSVYLAGEVGERLGAHNWGATIVCEGAGDSAGYRMHAGTLVVLGDVGTNVGVGMDGGILYALDFDPDLLHPGIEPCPLIAASLNETDLRVVTAILAEHVENTGSRLATLLLSDPDQLTTRFTKIFREGYDPVSNCSSGSTQNVWDRVIGATAPSSSKEA